MYRSSMWLIVNVTYNLHVQSRKRAVTPLHSLVPCNETSPSLTNNQSGSSELRKQDSNKEIICVTIRPLSTHLLHPIGSRHLNVYKMFKRQQLLIWDRKIL